MSAPPADLTRLPRHPAEGQRHRPDARIWVDRSGQWRPGVVVSSGGPAVTVRYRLSDGVDGRTGVDTVTWADLAAEARIERDAFIDGMNGSARLG